MHVTRSSYVKTINRALRVWDTEFSTQIVALSDTAGKLKRI